MTDFESVGCIIKISAVHASPLAAVLLAIVKYISTSSLIFFSLFNLEIRACTYHALFLSLLFHVLAGLMRGRRLPLRLLGESIEAQSHDNVTMLFSDLVGFTAICATATPMEIISLLQSLYTQFDVLCGDLDIYKVRTRGEFDWFHTQL